VKKQLESLIGTHVRIVQSEDIPLTGQLVAVNEDYASLLTDDQRIVCFPFAQIKSFQTSIMEVSKPVEIQHHKLPATFYELLETMFMQPVRVELGEGSKQGVLCNLTDELACIIINVKEMVYYPIDQIRNLTPVHESKQSSTQQSSESGQDGNQNSNSKNSNSGNGSNSDNGSKSGQEQGRDERSHQVSHSTNQASQSSIQINEKLAKRMLEQLDKQGAQSTTHSVMKCVDASNSSSKAPSLFYQNCRIRKSKKAI